MKLLTLSTFFLIFAFNSLSSAAETVDKILAVVNTEPVLKSDLDDLQVRLKKEGAVDESLLLGVPLSDIKSKRDEQLQYLIREKLVESEVKKQNLSISDDRVNSEIDELAKRFKKSRPEVEEYIKNQGFSLEDYKKIMKARIERQSFFSNEIISKLRITDEDAYNEYKNKNPHVKQNINEYKIAQIFFSSKKDGGIDAAEKRAEAVYKKIQTGESFESLANKFNEDTGGGDGGLLGTFKTGEFNSDLERGLSGLEKDEISKIVKTKQGFHILKILDKKISYDPTFLKYKEQIKSSLIDQNFQRQLKNWFESKKQDAYIKIYE